MSNARRPLRARPETDGAGLAMTGRFRDGAQDTSHAPENRVANRPLKLSPRVSGRALTVCPETHFPALRRLLGSSGLGCFGPLSGSETLQFSFWIGQPEGLSGVSGQTVRSY